MHREAVDSNLGISRRTLLKRGAVVGGTLIWAAPTVQTFGRAAFAQVGGTPCTMCVYGRTGQVVGKCMTTRSCCDCLEKGNANCDDVCQAIDCVATNVCP